MDIGPGKAGAFGTPSLIGSGDLARGEAGFTLQISDSATTCRTQRSRLNAAPSVGSSIKTKFEIQDGNPVLMRQPEVNFNDDKGGKPEGIDLIIGRLPRAAFGNSDGDRQMLEWTRSGSGARLAVLVHHDDAQREYAYGPATKVGTFGDSLMAEATKRGWTVISMKNDWRRIFSFDPP